MANALVTDGAPGGVCLADRLRLRLAVLLSWWGIGRLLRRPAIQRACCTTTDEPRIASISQKRVPTTEKAKHRTGGRPRRNTSRYPEPAVRCACMSAEFERLPILPGAASHFRRDVAVLEILSLESHFWDKSEEEITGCMYTTLGWGGGRDASPKYSGSRLVMTYRDRHLRSDRPWSRFCSPSPGAR